jgi:hypothetical protein
MTRHALVLALDEVRICTPAVRAALGGLSIVARKMRKGGRFCAADAKAPRACRAPRGRLVVAPIELEF